MKRGESEDEMVADISRREVISRALFALASNDPREFENILWIAFGDDWQLILKSLERRQIVRYVSSEDIHKITDEGRRVLGALRQAGHGVDSDSNEQQLQAGKP